MAKDVILRATFDEAAAPDGGDRYVLCDTLGRLIVATVPLPGSDEIQGKVADGAPAGATKPVIISGKDGGGTSRALLVDATGQAIIVAPTLAQEATFVAGIAALLAALGPLSTEATLAAIGALLTAQFDVALSTRGSEATLLNVLTTAAFQARINTLGQKTSAASTPVVLPSDQTVLVSPAGAATSATANVAQNAAASVLLLAANAGRKVAWIYNDPSNAAILYVKWGVGASSTSFTQALLKGEAMFWDGNEYSGIVEGRWSLAGAGAARVTETTL